MPAGVISDKKTKTTIVLEKELKSKLEDIAKNEHRSLNNLMVSILYEYAKSKEN